MRGLREKIALFHRAIIILLCMAAAFGLVACSPEQEEVYEKGYDVYFLNAEMSQLETHSRKRLQYNSEDQLVELLSYLCTNPDQLNYRAPLTLGFALKGYDRQGGMLTLDMDANYLKLDTTTEVLVRAALVRTLTQVTGIYYVKITVEGEPLLDVLGEEIGWMRANDFVYNDGNEINTYEPVRISLFFATKEGNRLKWTSRTKYYSTNTPLEKLIVEELIAGPLEGERDYYACIHPNTRITSIQTQDGTCYVNLSEEFLSVVGNVPTAVAKESITRSLLELNDIHRVHVMVNGRLVE